MASWLHGFKYRRKIIITERSGRDLTDYQVLIQLWSSNFDFSKAQENGEDIRFTDSEGNLLDYWIEKWDSANEKAKIWVKVPSIPANGSTEIWMYYGNPEAESESDAAATFIRVIDGLVACWNFDHDYGTTVFDSSGNNNHGTRHGTRHVTSKFQYGLDFYGYEYVDVPDSESLNITGPITIIGWLYLSKRNFNQVIVGKQSPGYKLSISSSNKVVFEIRDPDGVAHHNGGVAGGTSLSSKHWYFVGGWWDGNEIRSIVNGQFERPLSYDGQLGTTTNRLTLGREPYSSSKWLYGIVDELCIFNKALTAEEILDIYNNRGYATANYPGKLLVRKFTKPEPSVSLGEESGAEFLSEEILLEDEIGIGIIYTLSEALSLSDVLSLKSPYGETLYLTGSLKLQEDEIELVKPLYVESVSETLSLSDNLHFKYVYEEKLGLVDLLRIQQTLPGAYKLDGCVYQSASPEEPLADATVHLCSVEPRENIAYTYTDSDGYYCFLGVPEGEYVLIALKEGYTATIARIEIHSDYYQNFVVYPITVWCFVERICSPYGHVVKIYGIDDKVEDGIRTVTALLLFGDLYGKCTKGFSTKGYLVPLEDASISLIDFPGLDKRGLFEESEEIYEENGEICFKFSIQKAGDFEAFAFTISGPAGKDLRFKFVLGEREEPSFETEHPVDDIAPPAPPAPPTPPPPVYFPTPPSPPRYEYYYDRDREIEYIYRVSRERSRGGPGHARKGDKSTYRRFKERILIRLWERIYLREVLKLRQYPLPPKPPSPDLPGGAPGGGESADMIEWIHLSDEVELPPPISIIGRTVDTEGNPVPNANVVAVEKETGKVIAQTKSDSSGFYMIQVPSELEYVIYWSAPEYYTIQGYVKAGNKDIIDDRARIDVESELLLESGETFYYETIFVFWALVHSEGGKIYGYVYDSETKEPIPNAIIWINDGEFIAITDENGYYEQIVPPGHYRLYVTARGYARSRIYEGDISSNWRQDVYLDPAQMTIYVYDAIDSKPELKPIQNARIISAGKEYYTDENGKAEIYIIPGEIVRIEKARYKTLKIEAIEGEKTVFMHPCYKYTIELSERIRLR